MTAISTEYGASVMLRCNFTLRMDILILALIIQLGVGIEKDGMS
jgi:hypothetical protein